MTYIALLVTQKYFFSMQHNDDEFQFLDFNLRIGKIPLSAKGITRVTHINIL